MLQEMGREATPEDWLPEWTALKTRSAKYLKLRKTYISMETPIGDDEDSH